MGRRRARPMVKVTDAFQFRVVNGDDVIYGPTGRRRLSDIDSRHKTAWLWTMIWQESGPDRDEVLGLIDRHGHSLDDDPPAEGGDSWPVILDEMKRKKGLPVASEGDRPASQFRVVQWGDGEMIPIPPPPTWEGAEFMDGRVEMVLAYCNDNPGEGPIRIDELLPVAERRDEAAARLLEGQFIQTSA